jgi:hypothetical protein
MARSTGLSHWQQTVSRHLPHLTKPQAVVLALWSFGMVLAQSCGITSGVAVLAPLIDTQESALRQRLREWCYDADDTAGADRQIKRQALDGPTCFAPLLGWVLAWWPPTEQRLALALDAATLGQRFTVLCISVIYRGCAIPIAWEVVSATGKGAWRPHGDALFARLADRVPSEWCVIVLADRGRYARWLFRTIQARGGHPFLRINRGGNYRPYGERAFRPLALAVRQGGTGWSGRVTCFSSADCQLDSTLLAHWDLGHADPWLILTDLPPHAADVAWYGLRPMIECGFKDVKRGGWHWEQTKMTDPARARRLWLAIAVATLWVVSVGGVAEDSAVADGQPASMIAALPALTEREIRPMRRSRPRLLSCVRRGVLVIIATVLATGSLPHSAFIPEPWPKTIDSLPYPVHHSRSLQKAA